MATALEIEHLSKSFGAVAATREASLVLADGECRAIIGPNGAGKTTLIGQITGEIRPDRGRVRLFGTDVTGWTVHRRAMAGLARSFQITQLAAGFSALDNVAFAVQAREGHSFRFLGSARADRRLREPARAALAAVGLAERADVRAEILSHGERRQLELAVAMAMEPRILLLDEPMAGMGPQESAQMLAILQAQKGRYAMVLVEHDMDVVFALADQITVLVDGAVLAAGAPDVICADERVRAAYLGSDQPC